MTSIVPVKVLLADDLRVDNQTRTEVSVIVDGITLVSLVCEEPSVMALLCCQDKQFGQRLILLTISNSNSRRRMRHTLYICLQARFN